MSKAITLDQDHTATVVEEVTSPVSPHTAARVLLVMSEPTLRLSVLDRLRAVGLEVEVAGTGGLAVDKLRRTNVDAVLLDLGLSEESGVDVIRDIRRDPEFAELPIFGVAGANSVKHSRKATKAGAWKVFDLTTSSLDEMIAEVGTGLLAGGGQLGEVVQMGEPASDEPPLTDSILRVQRHLEHLSPGNQQELAGSYGQLRGKVQLVVKIAMLEGRYDIARLATNLAALLKLLNETPDHATSSTVRTVSLATEVLKLLATGGPLAAGTAELELQATVIDNEMVSRSVVCSALRSVRLKFEVFAHPSAAVRHVVDHATDLVVVNLGVKEVSFDFSKQLRENTEINRTPVLYVSGASEFDVIAPEGLHAEDELIARPFIFVELAVRALSLAMKSRRERSAPTDAQAAEVAEVAAVPPAAPVETEAPIAAAADSVAEVETPVVAESNARKGSRLPHGMRSAFAALLGRKAAPEAAAADKPVVETTAPAGGIQPAEEKMNDTQMFHRNRVAGPVGGTGETAFYNKNFEAKLLNDVMGWLVAPDEEGGAAAAVPPAAPAPAPAPESALGAELAVRQQEQQELVARAGQNQAELQQLQEELQREREQRQQLETFVQQLMESQGGNPPVDGAPTDAKSGKPNEAGRLRVPFVEASEEIQEELKALSTLADELREELEAKQQERTELLARMEGNQTEIKLLSDSLAKERKEREAMAARLKDAETFRKSVSDHGEELAKAMAAAEQAAAATQAETERSQQLEAELKQVRTEQLELQRKLDEGSKSVGDVAKQKSELEQQLQTSKAEVDRAHEARTKLAADQQRLQQAGQELQAQLAEARKAVEQAESARQNESGRAQQLEQELAQLKEKQAGFEAETGKLKAALSAAEAASREAGDKATAQQKELADLWKLQEELDARLAGEKKKQDESEQHKAALQKRAGELEGELKQARAAQDKQLAEWKRLEASLNEQLQAARTAAEKAEAATRDGAKRAVELEQEVSRVKGLQDSTQAQLAAEQQNTGEARKRGDQLAARAAGLEKEFSQAQQQLAAERKAIAELGDKKVAVENTLAAARNELKQAEAARDAMAAEKKKVEAEAGTRVSRADEIVREARSASQKEKERADKFEAEVTQLWQTRDALKEKLVAEQKLAEELGRKKSELETRLQEVVTGFDKARTELAGRTSALAALEAQHKQLGETSAALSSEVALLSEQRKAHAGELAAMERRVRDSVSQLTRATADLETERGERRRIEQRANSLATQLRDLRGELNQHLQLEKDLQSRVSGIEQQLREREQALAQEKTAHESERAQRRQAEQKAANLGTGLDAAKAEITNHLRTARENHERLSRLEQQLRAREESLVRVTEHLEAERGERRRIEERAGKVGAQLQEAQAQIASLEQAGKDFADQVSSLGEKLASREDAQSKLVTQLEGERSERHQLEQRAAGLSAQLKELHGDLNEHLEAEKNYQSRIADLEKETRARQESLTVLQAELEKEAADRELAEEQLKAAGDFSAKLKQYQSSFEEARTSFDQSRAEMQSRLQEGQAELAQRDERLQQAAQQRQKLEQELAAARRELRDQTQQNSVELSRLKSELQGLSLERQRLEGDAMNSRFVSLNNNRSSRALINGYRRKLQSPVDTLMTSARQLLEFSLNAEVKKVAESVLEKAIALQTSVRDSDFVETATADADADVEKTEKVEKVEKATAPTPAPAPVQQAKPAPAAKK